MKGNTFNLKYVKINQKIHCLSKGKIDKAHKQISWIRNTVNKHETMLNMITKSKINLLLYSHRIMKDEYDIIYCDKKNVVKSAGL